MRPITDTTTNEPRFDLDVEYGKQAEFHVAELLDWLGTGNGRVEVKRKRYCDLSFYVETACTKKGGVVYEPSGITVTTADAWAFVIGDTGITVLIPIDELRAMLDDPSTRDTEQPAGPCKSRGKLINVAAVLYRCKQRRASKPSQLNR